MSRARTAPPSRLRSPLGRARGLGSAKEGVEHWIAQRITAVALVPLALWFVAAMIGVVGADYDTMQDWVGRPLPAIVLVLLLIADYGHGELARIGCVVVVRLVCVALAIAGIVAVLSLALGVAD